MLPHWPLCPSPAQLSHSPATGHWSSRDEPSADLSYLKSSCQRVKSMDLPSYDEATLPPAYDASMSPPSLHPSTPPPTYGEAVEFPVLSMPRSLHQNTNVFIFPTTNVPVVESRSISVTQGSPVVMFQPQPVCLVEPCHLTDSPAMVTCSFCGETGTTKVSNRPNADAWCLCVLLTLVGLVCGFCLLPLFASRFQEARHSCPHCNHVIHIYNR